MGICYKDCHYFPWFAFWLPVVVGLHIRYRLKPCPHLVIYRKNAPDNNSFQRHVGRIGQSLYPQTLLYEVIFTTEVI